MSLGEDRVRISFNPSGHGTVDHIKAEIAALIDLCEQGKQDTLDGETKRLWALAQTDLENAAMWAVKAATAPLSEISLPATGTPQVSDGPKDAA